jgi:hypothetical protein
LILSFHLNCRPAQLALFCFTLNTTVSASNLSVGGKAAAREAERHVENLYRDALETMFQGDTYDRLMDDSTQSTMGAGWTRDIMSSSFRELLEALVNQRIAEGADPQELFEELRREANLVFGHYNLRQPWRRYPWRLRTKKRQDCRIFACLLSCFV